MGTCEAILTQARELIATKGFTTRPYAVDASGADVDCISPHATKYSVGGAIKCVLGLAYYEYDELLGTCMKCVRKAHTKDMELDIWLKDQYTPVEEVLATLDRAIAYAEEFDL